MDEKSCVHVAFPRFTANSISNEHDGELLCGKGGRAVSPLVVSAPTVPGPTRRQDRVGGCETQPLACFPTVASDILRKRSAISFLISRKQLV